jgi:hypothetical protein
VHGAEQRGTPQDRGARAAAVDGLYTPMLFEGRRDMGFYNFNLSTRAP